MLLRQNAVTVVERDVGGLFKGLVFNDKSLRKPLDGAHERTRPFKIVN